MALTHKSTPHHGQIALALRALADRIEAQPAKPAELRAFVELQDVPADTQAQLIGESGCQVFRPARRRRLTGYALLLDEGTSDWLADQLLKGWGELLPPDDGPGEPPVRRLGDTPQ